MLCFDDTGDGDPLVLIHGLAASRWIWSKALPLLPEWRRIAVDVPGFGDSPAAGPGFDLEEVADAIWDGLPVDGPVDLVGHSMGGAVALTAAVLRPERVRRLVLCAPAGLRPVPPLAARVAGAMGARGLDLRRAAARAASTPAGRRALLGASTAAGDHVSEEDVRSIVLASATATRVGPALAAVLDVDLRSVLPELAVPLGLVWGSYDRVIPRSTIAEVLASRPETPLEFVPKTGHLPMVERPAAFAAVLRQTLGRLAAEPSAQR